MNQFNNYYGNQIEVVKNIKKDYKLIGGCKLKRLIQNLQVIFSFPTKCQK